LVRPLTLPKFVAIRQKVCEISVVENFAPTKSRAKFTIGHQICQHDRPYARFYRQSVVKLAPYCFFSEISLVLYRKYFFVVVHTPSSFTQNLETFPRVRPMSSVVPCKGGAAILKVRVQNIMCERSERKEIVSPLFQMWSVV